MSEVLSLFFVLFLVYALQCIAAAPTDTSVFLLGSRLRARLLRHSWLVMGSRYRLFLLNPFLPSCSAIYAEGLPFSFVTGPAGEVNGVQLATPTAFDEGRIDFKELHSFASRFKELLLDNSPIATLRTERRANYFATFLKELQSLPPLERRAFIDRELRRISAVDAIRARLELFSHCVAFLSSLSFSLFLFLFVLSPVAIYSFGLRRLWVGLLLALVFYSALILWAFRRAHLRLYPKKTSGDIQHLLTIALSPLAGIRAIDSIASDLLEDFHPVAIACALLPESDFPQFAQRELRRAKFLTGDAIQERFLTDFLVTQNLDPRLLLSPPHPEDVRSRTYCPLCLTQYVLEEGVCHDCGGVRLQPLTPIKT